MVGGASTAANLQGGGQGQLVYNSATNTTSFLSYPGAGYALTSVGTGSSVAWQLISNLAVTNNGVTSLTGTANQITASASTGSVILSLPNTVIVTDIQVTGTNSTLDTVGSSATSIVNKQYVDNLASGLDIHGSVRLVQASSIGASYVQSGAAGTSAVGAFLISTTQVALPAIDGVTISATGASQRVLIAGGATGRTNINGSGFVQTPVNSNIANGIYFVAALGGVGTNWILVRATDTDDSVELTAGTFTFIEEGTVYKDTGWACTNDTTNYGPIQFGLDNANTGTINFSQFTGAAAISFGQGLTKVGNTVASNVNLSATGVAAAIGYTQFNIGGPSVGGAADTGYYPTFSVRTGTIHTGTSLLTLNHTGFSLVGSTNTPATLTVTGNISLPNPGAGGNVAYSSDANTLAFVAGTAEQILKSNGTSAPSFVNQSTLVVGGATTAANIQGGTIGALTYQSAANTTGFITYPGAGYALTSVGSGSSSVWQALSTMLVGNATNSTTATNANNVAVNSATGIGSSYLVFVSAQTGNLPILTNANVTVDASTSTITATLAGTATTANRVGITTQSSTGASYIYFGSAASGSAALGATTDIYINASTGTIIAKAFTGLATTATLANTVGITTQSSAGASYIYFGSAASGSAALGATTTIYVTASTGTIVATNFSGIASSATRVGITTSVGAGTSYLYFGDIASGYGGIGATTDITVNASTGTIIAKAFTGLATTATLANNVGITTQSSAGASYIYFGSTASGSAALGATTTIYVTASTGTIVATNFSGIASSATRVGITTSISSSDLPIVFANSYTPDYAALGSSTLLTYQASTGKITNGIWAGTAITTGRGGTGLITVSANQLLIGASTGNTWAAIGSSLVPVVCVGANPPASPSGAIGNTQSGQLWWDSTYGVLKIYYADTDTSQWVDATPVLGSSGGGSSTKRSYVMTFGAGFTPSTGADTVQILIPYAPDNTSKYYFIKRLDYRANTAGTGVSFYIERFTGGDVAFDVSSGNRIHSASGASFVAASGIFITSYTQSSSGASFVSSSGIAGSILSGDYLRLNYSHINSAATMSVSIIIEEQ